VAAVPQIIGVLAPSGRDAAVIAEVLGKAGIEALISSRILELLKAVDDHRTGAVLVTEEAFQGNALETMKNWLEAQPPWSDLPVLLLTKRQTSSLHQSSLSACLGNVTLLERPLSIVTLISAARAALRARARQHEAEHHILQLAARERELSEERARLEQSEARLREAHEKLEQRFAEALAEKRVLADIVEGTDAFVQVSDLHYRWLAINRASAAEFERIYGVRPQVGQSMLDVIGHMPEHRKSVQEVWARALAGEEFTVVGEFGDPDHDRRFYEMKFNTLRNENGEQIGAYQFVYDVTDRVREQQQLSEAQARMHEMAKLETLGQLTGGVAHDFNNLLTPIVGALDMLHRRHQEDPRSIRLITGALEASERAAVLVQRLLTFARRQNLEARAIDAGELIRGMRDLIQRSIGPHVQVEVAIEENVPACRIDPNQLELAVLNLAVNASDAMPGGGFLKIEVSQRVIQDNEVDGLKGGAYIRLAVSDTGTGMDQATINRSVEPFFTTKGLGKGTGLGLSMVHGLAAQSGGALNLKSRPGEGTTAEIWLPVSGHCADPLTLPSDHNLEQARQTTILLVDDEEIVRRATADMLRELGHEVVEASSATTALDLLRDRQDVEVIVSDYLMPGMRGGELIRKAQSMRPGLRALLITGYAKLAGAEADLARLSKPFRVTDLAREIEKLLSDEKVVELASRRDRANQRGS
jgi:PAS domain S-box-containing protein